MNGKWIDKKNVVLADTVYCDNQLVARDITVSLPEITFSTAEINAMGPLELPIPSSIEAMEATINRDGMDSNAMSMLTPEKHNFEVRYVQNRTTADGTSTPEGCKAFISGIPKKIPGGDITPGSASEREVTLSVIRYQLYVGGEEMFCIDKLNSICRIMGRDYYSSIAQLL